LIKFNALNPRAFKYDNQAIIDAQLKRNRRNANRRIILEQFKKRVVSNEGRTESEVQSIAQDSQTRYEGNEYRSEPADRQVEHGMDGGICEARASNADNAC
jgi:hypothetical protein